METAEPKSLKQRYIDLLNTCPGLYSNAYISGYMPIEENPGDGAYVPAYVSIDSAALEQNVKTLKSQIDAFFPTQSQLCYIVKANAYGHGMDVPLLLQLLAKPHHESSIFAVAKFTEALILRRRLRQAYLNARILTMIPLFPEEAEMALAYDFISVVSQEDTLEALQEAGKNRNKKAEIFIELNSGMNRQGITENDVLSLIRKAMTLSHIKIVGIMTHLAVADEPDDAEKLHFTQQQLHRFHNLLLTLESELKAQNLPFPEFISMFNSPGLIHLEKILEGPTTQDDLQQFLNRNPETKLLFRPGVCLYGLSHDSIAEHRTPGLKPVMRVFARVGHITTLNQGEGVSYGAHFHYAADHSTTRGLLQIGYGDGLLRAPNLGGHEPQLYAQVHGQIVPIIGRICMDQCTIDIGGLTPPVKTGDIAMVLGDTGELSACKIAARYGTINYEIVNRMNALLPRIIC